MYICTSKIFFLEIIIDSQEFAKTVQRSLLYSHLVSPNGYNLHNYSTISKPGKLTCTMYVYSFMPFYYMRVDLCNHHSNQIQSYFSTTKIPHLLSTSSPTITKPDNH